MFAGAHTGQKDLLPCVPGALQQQAGVHFLVKGHIENNGAGPLPDGQIKNTLLGAPRRPGAFSGGNGAPQGSQVPAQGLSGGGVRYAGRERRCRKGWRALKAYQTGGHAAEGDFLACPEPRAAGGPEQRAVAEKGGGSGGGFAPGSQPRQG